MESTTKTLYIFFFIASSLVAVEMIEEPLSEEKKQTLDSLSGKLCPPLGIRIPFEIATIQTATKMFGCAYIEHDRSISFAPVFNLWLERPVRTNTHSHCKNIYNMDHFVFECLSKRVPAKNDEIVKGWHYLTLLDHTNSSNSNKNENYLVYRCAVYDVHEAPAEGVKIIRMAISAPNLGQLHENQCEGLSKTMGKDDLPEIPEGRRTWPDGSMYIYLLGKPPRDGPPRRKGVIVKYPTSRPTTTITPVATTSDKKKNGTTTTTKTTTTTTEMPEDFQFSVGAPPEW